MKMFLTLTGLFEQWGCRAKIKASAQDRKEDLLRLALELKHAQGNAARTESDHEEAKQKLEATQSSLADAIQSASDSAKDGTAYKLKLAHVQEKLDAAVAASTVKLAAADQAAHALNGEHSEREDVLRSQIADGLRVLGAKDVQIAALHEELGEEQSKGASADAEYKRKVAALEQSFEEMQANAPGLASQAAELAAAREELGEAVLQLTALAASKRGVEDTVMRLELQLGEALTDAERHSAAKREHMMLVRYIYIYIYIYLCIKKQGTLYLYLFN